MDFADSPAEGKMRAEVRAWLDQNANPMSSTRQALTVFQGAYDEAERIAQAKTWQHKLAEARLAAVTWPVEWGGRDATALEALVLGEEMARYDVPTQVFSIGTGMVGPTILAHGTDDQRQRYLPPILRGEEIWCQLWSEPGAGSDLAGLSTKAELRGDDYVINGQKVWTSGAHYSDFGLGLFRTDPQCPKHLGISMIIVPMRSPGITIRPLRQINGQAHFNEVFFDDVHVTAAARVGAPNDGWRVARTTMTSERLSAVALVSATRSATLLLDLAGRTIRNGVPAAQDPVIRQRLARTYSLARVLDLTVSRVRAGLARTGTTGPEASILKLLAAMVGTELAETGVAVLGLAGCLQGDEVAEQGRWADALLGSIAMHIGGGTDEIQRNIIGEAALGLPREADPLRDVPFSELPVMHRGNRT